ncbi:MAG: LptE family protein [Bdellovibrionia bacterium]
MQARQFIQLFVIIFLLSGCAYRLGTSTRTIPGGAKKIAIPVFTNKTAEPGIEMAFTNALLQEFYRSKVANVVGKAQAETLLTGTIKSLEYLPGAKKTSGDSSVPFLSEGAVLATEYRILLKVELRVIENATGRVLWSGDFDGERTYIAPQVTLAGVNSVNPLYNLSARRQNIEVVALDLMAEAHDRITENF